MLRSLVAASVALALTPLAGCKGRDSEPHGPVHVEPDPHPSAVKALEPAALKPTPPKGMVWIPPGILLAGTPEDRLPRAADEEMPGAQVVMRGFFIDELPYPNEQGAIPLTNITQPQAEELCAQQEKRLCTELEWERACKGPNNTTYPYGDSYRASECETGSLSSSLPPAGALAGCRSGFGVRDLHGGVWQWTSSPWGRGSSGNLVTLRGGNSNAGEVVGRCANAEASRPSASKRTVGFRCCSGERNLAEVTIDIVRGEPLQPVSNDKDWMASLAKKPPAELARLLDGSSAPFKVLQAWKWHPIGNEELILQSGCANPGVNALCGITVARLKFGVFEPLAFASSGWWLPVLQDDSDPREMWVFGGDKDGGYRRRLAYSWGSVITGPPERNVKKKRKDKTK